MPQPDPILMTPRAELDWPRVCTLIRMDPTLDSSQTVPTWSWLVLAAIVGASLLIDLVGHRGERGIGRRAAVIWSVVWISLGLSFAGFIALQLGRDDAEDYLTAFLVEKSLSVDNLFVFMIVFKRLAIPGKEQHRVLLWGILSAFVIRAVFIFAGVAILDAWHGVVYVLGAFLVYTGVKTARSSGDAEPNDDGRILSFLRRHVPLSDRLHGHRFTVVERGRRLATPLLVALLVIELTDILFAVDSIPAVFAVTENPFIVYSSNIFALLGLRSLYLVMADLLRGLRYLHLGIAAILVFVGAKMLGSHFVRLPHWASLVAIAGALAVSIVASIVVQRRTTAHAAGSSGQTASP